MDGSLPLAYGLILVIASFMVFNDLENAGNMASLLQMLAASMDTANSIDDTPVMELSGKSSSALLALGEVRGDDYEAIAPETTF